MLGPSRWNKSKICYFIEQEDILLSKNLLSIIYEKSQKFNLDIFQFKSLKLIEKTKIIKLNPEKIFPDYDSIIT